MPSTFESKGEDNKSKSKKNNKSEQITKSITKPVAKPKPKAAIKQVQQQRIKNLVASNDYFGPQYNSTSELPNPDASLQVLATGVVEVIAGTRQIDQLARLLSDEVYQRLSRRAVEARQRRDALGQKTHYQNFSVLNMMNSSPRDGVIESVVLLNAQRRTRAVTIRLEGINNRWRATAVSVL
jgi:hypothetical protein